MGHQKARHGLLVKDDTLFDISKNHLLTAKAVAQILGISHKTVYKWAKQFRIKSVPLGRCVRFKSEDIQAILSGQRGL
jgi:excisionase family DNA binding protein